MAKKRIKVVIRMDMDEDEQAKRQKVHDSLPLPDFAKDAYIYRIGLEHHTGLLRQRETSNAEDRSSESYR